MSSTSTFAMQSLKQALPRAGPSSARQVIYSTTVRSASTAASEASSAVHIPAAQTGTAPPRANLLHPKNGASLIDHINTTFRQTTLDPSSHLTNLFSRRHPNRIKTGSILTVLSYTNSTKTATSPFSGVLMGIRRRGVDSSFTLRNVINKTGVESAFKIYSPMVKEIRVVKRAENTNVTGRASNGLKDLKRAKVGYLREKQGLMERIAGALKSSQPQKSAVQRRR